MVGVLFFAFGVFHPLPESTVINVVNDQAVISRGVESGYCKGQRGVVVRHGEVKCLCRISKAMDGKSILQITRTNTGTIPGDKVVVYRVGNGS